MAFNQDVKAVLPRPGVDAQFLAYWFLGQSDRMLRLVTESTHGTKKIDLGILQQQRIAVPTEREQATLAQVIRSSDVRIKQETEEVEKLVSLKAGLMDDLLTGRVRVQVE